MPKPRLALLLPTFLAIHLGAAAQAHHFKGMPHFAYFENYPQAPQDEYLAQAGEYEMHFCSDGCQNHFVEEGEAAIIALDLASGDDTTATD